MKDIKVGSIVKTNKFKIGDIICAVQNWKNRIPIFFRATNDDVKNYSGLNNLYLVIKVNKNI